MAHVEPGKRDGTDGRTLRPFLEVDHPALATFSFTSVAGAARCLMHPNSVLRLIRAGVIPAARVRQRWCVPLSYFVELEAEARRPILGARTRARIRR
jgi:hypothetical protein